ncbi:hypothetical protein [Synechococcus sp. UW140]|uniref:hypothetical protein n=1 Tax=Synechococcus sp. UW140 TaxID=368503 RepID=UPI000E0E1045|nr:hypothetical protein [Synechococcus sp. UW140]
MTVAPVKKPGVVLWAKVYMGGLSLMYLVLILLSPLMFLSGEEEAVVTGLVFLVLGIPCLVISFVPLFLPPKPWVWVWILVLIAIGMTSVCCLPVTIPLLIFWIKPDVRRYYGNVVA